jgi:hypothetical protein
VALTLIVAIFVSPLRAQQQTPSAPPAQPQKTTADETTFDTLLSDDSYKLYLEVRNVGTLLTTGGAGEIVEPIVKLADPGPELRSLIKFLKDNSEALASSRLMLATWPAHTGIPSTMAAIEFATPEEAAKFTPKLETFLPSVMPPVPVEEPTTENTGAPVAANEKAKAEAGAQANASIAKPTASPATTAAKKPETRSRYVLTRTGTLVVISDTPVNLAKLHPRASALLSEDNNFRTVRDRFASEPLFFFFNVKLEDKTRPKPTPTPVITEEERERIRKEEEAVIAKAAEEEKAEPEPEESPTPAMAETTAVLGTISPSPTPTPTKEQEVQRIAGNQIGSLLSVLGQGEPQWPDAIGLAVALDNEEYVTRAILIQSDTAKRLTLPFVPQLISGPAVTAEAASILPDDTEILVSTSIDFAQTYREMKKQAEATAKQARESADASATAEGPPDPFVEFEKKAGFKIADDLLPVLGNEIAVAMSLKQANMVNMFGLPAPPAPKSSGDEKNAKPLPVFMIAIRDREAARRIMPRVLQGLGIGEANLLAQTERRGDAEIVNYAGIFAYGFVGNFLVVSDPATVRRLADAQTNSTTLASNNAFRTSRHWQPRQTVGEIYVSPAMMEGYQQQVSKQAGTMDQSMRDFLLKLSPKSSAITYALSHDALGTMHELHLPKNLILAMIAGTTAAMSAMKEGSPEMNEMIAISALRMIAGAEDQFKSGAGHGSYGSLDQLAEQKLISKEVFEKYGYRVDLTTSSQGFEAVAMPLEYGKTGKRSFFIDQSGVLRGDDHGGGPATISDKPLQQ